MLKIPLLDGVENSVRTTIDGINYTFVTKYNKRTELFSMDVQVNDVDLITGIVLTSGVDISRYPSLPLNRIYCVNKVSPYKDITLGGLGNNGLVVIVEDSDLEE